MGKVKGIERILRGRYKQEKMCPRRFHSSLCIFYELFLCLIQTWSTFCVCLASILGELMLVSLLIVAVSCQRVAEMETAFWWIILVIFSLVYWLMIWSSPTIRLRKDESLLNHCCGENWFPMKNTFLLGFWNFMSLQRMPWKISPMFFGLLAAVLGYFVWLIIFFLAKKKIHFSYPRFFSSGSQLSVLSAFLPSTVDFMFLDLASF